MSKSFILASTAIATASAGLTATYANAENSPLDQQASSASANMELELIETPVEAASLNGVVAPAGSDLDLSAEGQSLTPAVDSAAQENEAQGEQAAPTPSEPEPTEKEITAKSLKELVGKIGNASLDTKDLECLAGAVYFEARGEPLDGQLAVAKVVMNRAQSRQFPSSYCGVVTQRSQFSFVRNGRIPKAPRASAAWKRAKAISRIAHEELWDSAADDALYFHAKYVSPSWRHAKTARATINSHIFYR